MSWGTRIAISSESFLATHIGLKVAEAGGNEVDVAVAVSLSLAYLLPHLGGIGGDFLALIDDGNKVRAILGLGWAPSGISKRPPRRGLESAVVPGMAAGLAELHKMGSMEWSKLVNTVADLLEERAVVHPSFAEALAKAELEGPGKRLYDVLPKSPGASYKIGPLLSLYRKMAEHGPRYFYEAMAESLGDGRYFDKRDFMEYGAEVREPLAMEYKGWTLHEAPPPSLGFAVLLTLRLAADSLPRLPLSYGRIRAVIAAARRAHWARDKYLGDCEVPVQELLAGGIELGEAEAPTPTGDTTYFAVAGKEYAISAIQSLYYAFGSGHVEGKWGVVLNNRASDFTSGPNAPAPRKRPAHTLSAVLAVNGGDRIALGSSAGHYRPVIYAQLVQNFLDYGMELRRAVWAQRFIWTGGWRAIAERGYEGGPDVEFVEYPSRLGVAAAAVKLGGALAAVADIRGDGGSGAI
ncbi:MAG: gamma-glutamyltransferase [Thermoproteus sp.]|nr:gamma-glutamyltransferase [Thermoproteus sp.]